MGTATDVLITVMTYPLPSREYRELICTAGVTRDGEWVRLYPIDYRYQPRQNQFRKYQWVNVELDEHGHGHDDRKESRRPNLDSLQVLGPPLRAGDWKERRAVIDRLPAATVAELHNAYDSDKTSLGLVKPSRVLDLVIEEADRQWKPKWREMFDQVRLFGPQPKLLRKLPFKFSYVFECADSGKPHKTMIEDWELGVLFLKQWERRGNEVAAAEDVRQKYLGMCAPSRDTHFYMGTTFPYNSWVVLGVYYPPAVRQDTLFQETQGI